jgi:hypothetical protein
MPCEDVKRSLMQNVTKLRAICNGLPLDACVKAAKNYQDLRYEEDNSCNLT